MGSRRVSNSLALAAMVALVSATTLAQGDGLRVIPLVKDGTVLISFSLADGYTDDVRAAIKSGLKTTFTYTVDLVAQAPAWLDRTIASTVVSTSVQYDNLTRRHTVVRAIDGRVEQAEVMEDDAAVRRLVTSIDRLALFRTVKLQANREYVRARPRRSTAAERRHSLAVGRWPIGADQVHLYPLTPLTRRKSSGKMHFRFLAAGRCRAACLEGIRCYVSIDRG